MCRTNTSTLKGPLKQNTDRNIVCPSTSWGTSLKNVEHFWVAVKELKLSYYIGETLLFTMYTHYGNFI